MVTKIRHSWFVIRIDSTDQHMRFFQSKTRVRKYLKVGLQNDRHRVQSESNHTQKQALGHIEKNRKAEKHYSPFLWAVEQINNFVKGFFLWDK